MQLLFMHTPHSPLSRAFKSAANAAPTTNDARTEHMSAGVAKNSVSLSIGISLRRFIAMQRVVTGHEALQTDAAAHRCASEVFAVGSRSGFRKDPTAFAARHFVTAHFWFLSGLSARPA